MTAGYVDTHYARTLPPTPPRPALAGAVEAEVCVVGGGLAGLSAALGLAERGRSVVLLEARRVGWGASGRNAGFVAAGFAANSRGLVRRLGREHARALFDLSRAGVALVRERVGRHGIDCGPVVPGYLRVSRRDNRAKLERRRAFLAETFGAEIELWPRERVRAALVSARYFDALYDADAFHLHPLRYCLGLAAAAERAGARVFEGTPARALADGVVEAAGGRVRARDVIVACGGYTDGLVRRLAGAIVPVATYVVVTEPLGPRLREAIRVDCAISETRRTGNYYRPLADGRLLWGGRMTARTREPARLTEMLLADMRQVYPRLAAAIAEGDGRWRLFAPFGLVPTFGPLGIAAAQLTYRWYQLRDAVL